ncbi:hypothetical protein C5N14_17880 [Micromonospora sp. MW-13]|uniref:hypothetical protein n=1 Tax=Micromonospora sp. MW-13 TaxID=2094022 RepID=UPI000E445907|nr:hypothetical protein [Micromonospora sp. MW-13]RGC67651.1 hypothetical protein C5N14_17880 [Micromonospora sp. MW-13]
MHPSPGDLLTIDGRASVQFAGDRALTFRVVSVPDLPTYHGWIWLTGYVLDHRGLATAKREIYVQLAGLRPALPAGPPGQVRPRRTGDPPVRTGAARPLPPVRTRS